MCCGVDDSVLCLAPLPGPDLDKVGPGAVLNMGPPGADVDSLGPRANAVFTAISARFSMA